MPTYKLLEHWDINALIDINGRTKSSEHTPDDITFNREIHPLCRAWHEKCPWGGKTCQGCPKFRFPLRCGHVSSCPYEAECSPGIYRRTVYIKNHADLRFHSSTPRDSEQYMAVYCEQVINRILNDYCLQHLKIRGKDHFF